MFILLCLPEPLQCYVCTLLKLDGTFSRSNTFIWQFAVLNIYEPVFNPFVLSEVALPNFRIINIVYRQAKVALWSVRGYYMGIISTVLCSPL